MAPKAYLGIAFGNSSLKLAQTSQDEKIVRCTAAPIPDGIMQGGRIAAWDGAADFLKETIKKEGFTAKHAAFVIPEEAIFQRRTTLPLMNTQVLQTNLPYEFHDFITDDKDAYYYDYSLITRTDKEMTLNAVAVSKKEMGRLDALCRSARLRLMQATPRSRAISNLFHQMAPDVVRNDFAVLDLGATGTRIDIYSGGFYQVTRTIETGGNAIRDAIARELDIDPHIAEVRLRENQDDVLGLPSCRDIYGSIAVDIMHAINYYVFEHHDNTLETMYYFGGNAHNGYLMSEIADIVPLELMPLSELKMSDCMDGEALVTSAPAIGICWNKEFFPGRVFGPEGLVEDEPAPGKSSVRTNVFGDGGEEDKKAKKMKSKGGGIFGRKKG
ncbi:MAG: pilus assembly protein PilM [Lachnospiraceae bacterium]|nr:pilus assembly protein PilM [Lachnospiraceae bacterium]